MRWLVVALLLLAAGFVSLAVVPPAPGQVKPTDPTYTQGTYSLRLTRQPCQFPEYKEWLEDQGIPPALASVTTQAGRPTILGCWVKDMAGDILQQDPTTSVEQSPIDAGWFK